MMLIRGGIVWVGLSWGWLGAWEGGGVGRSGEVAGGGVGSGGFHSGRLVSGVMCILVGTCVVGD